MGRPRKLNQYILDNTICYGKLSDKDSFLFDRDDYEKIKGYTWRKDTHGYIYTLITINKKRKRLTLHRLIMGVESISWKKIQIDHKNTNKLDNRKCNLRRCSSSQNQINKILPRKDNTSKNIGVSFRKGKWNASIGINGKKIFLGAFRNKKDAIKIRKEAEEDFFGEFSRKEN